MNTLEQDLIQGKSVLVPIKGFSMFPLLNPDRDYVLLKGVETYSPKNGNRISVKKYDIALFRRNDTYILHRVKEAGEHDIVLQGDGNYKLKEHCKRDEILAIAYSIQRKNGRIINPYTALALFEFKIWDSLHPIRRPILRILHIIRRLFS